MEYICKNSKKESPLTILLGDLSMRVKMPGKDEVIHYTGIKSVLIAKSSNDFFFLTLKTFDNTSYTVSNRYCHPTGEVEDKSSGYAMFARILNMHLINKSKAEFKYVKNIHIPGWQKILLLALLFGSSFLLSYFDFSLFYPVLPGVALSLAGLCLLILLLSERKRTVEPFTHGEIPIEFLPVDRLFIG